MAIPGDVAGEAKERPSMGQAPLLIMKGLRSTTGCAHVAGRLDIRPLSSCPDRKLYPAYVERPRWQVLFSDDSSQGTVQSYVRPV